MTLCRYINIAASEVASVNNGAIPKHNSGLIKLTIFFKHPLNHIIKSSPNLTLGTLKSTKLPLIQIFVILRFVGCVRIIDDNIYTKVLSFKYPTTIKETLKLLIGLETCIRTFFNYTIAFTLVNCNYCNISN